MSLLRPLALRTLTLVGVFFIVLLMLVLTLGLTGYSDRILSATLSEQIRAERSSLAVKITNPEPNEIHIIIKTVPADAGTQKE